MKLTVERTFVKADPGWFVVEPGYPDQGGTIERLYLEPVIAFLIERAESPGQWGSDPPMVSFAVIPITVEGEQDGEVCLKRPDSIYQWPDDRWASTEQEALEYFKELEAKRKARAKTG